MFSSINKAWTAIKDGAVETGAKAYLNGKIGGFGEVTQFAIDSKERTMQMEVALKGESSPVSVKVGAYEVIETNSATYITVRDVSASREWIGLAVEQYVAGRQFKIPDALKRFLA